MSAIMPAVADALDLLLASAQAIAVIGPIVQKAQAEGRTTLTVDEWAQITGNETSAEANLAAAIAAARARSSGAAPK